MWIAVIALTRAESDSRFRRQVVLEYGVQDGSAWSEEAEAESSGLEEDRDVFREREVR